MRIAVCGLWHLGCVTAACAAAAGHEVVAIDFEPAVVAALAGGRPPVDEPGLAETIRAELESGRLRFASDPAEAAGADLVWLTPDTPVGEDDRGDAAAVRAVMAGLAPALAPGMLVLVSSQVPVGFTASLEREHAGRGLRFGYTPDRLQLGDALARFRDPAPVVAGLRDPAGRELVERVFATLGVPVSWMAVESAELAKHALNAFLAASVALTNELARVAEVAGAQAGEVEAALRGDPRIGPRAYVAAGGPFAGGTLGRDVQALAARGREAGGLPLVEAVLRSNTVQQRWITGRVRAEIQGVADPVVAILGVTYKAGTSTLRRSFSLQLARALKQAGVAVRLHDPVVAELPDGAGLELRADPASALAGADVAVVANPWTGYRELRAEDFLDHMRRAVVFDLTGVMRALGGDPRLRYLAPGRPQPSSAEPASSGHSTEAGDGLAGRSAIVTGGSMGLGLAIATRLVRGGAHVLVAARGEAALREAEAKLQALAHSGQRLAAVVADVASEAGAQRVLERAQQVLPGLDVLVNNAGVPGPVGPLHETAWEEWEEAVRVDLFGPVRLCRLVIPVLRRRGYGKILNVSGGGAATPRPRMSAYAAAKAALVRVTETLAHELREDHIDVNALAPGALNTRFLEQYLALGPEKLGPAAWREVVAQRDGGGFPPERSAELAAFLVSSRSDGITGRLLSAPWDAWEELAERREELAASDLYTLRRIVPADRGLDW